MEKFTANYCHSNSNFIITNLPNTISNAKYSNIIRIVQNLITRGNPTIASDFLRQKLNLKRNYLDEIESVKFLSASNLDWIRSIKGNVERDDFPAFKFYNDLRKILKSVGFIADLTIAEYPIQFILPEISKAFEKQSVDFYIPILKTVIEVDGQQHQNQKEYDDKRDKAFERNDIKVLRVSASDVNADNYDSFISKIRERYVTHKAKIDEYSKWFDIDHSKIHTQITLTSVARLQVFLLELIRRDALQFNAVPWDFYVANLSIKHYLDLAISDLSLWLENIAGIFNQNVKIPKVNIHVYEKLIDVSHKSKGIVIDFDLFKRWDDTCKWDGVFQIRSDFDDEANYFCVQVSDPVVYSLNEETHTKHLEFILKNLFGFESFNSGQLKIIINCMNGEDTIGLLPTGGGKSLTYQICALLQPALSFVVVPLKSLMVDQVESVSSKHGISHTTYINSDLNPEIAKKRLRDFTLGKYFYLLITPEKLQNKYFRSEFEQLNETKAISIAVIDEAHCLSEWGHDFRTSYLALSNTINRIITPSPRYLALTATASSKVLQDLMNELNISSQNVLTIPDFSRSELEFEIIPVEKTLRNNKLLELIQISKTQNSVKSGTLVFTHNVKGKEGCYQISELIHNLTGLTTSFYSGSQPLNWEKNNGIKFEKFKDDVQKKFMSDEIDVLVATKSFGMGIDKGNIRLTVHYGLPASLESFYQEAGRAGRDKKKSYCKVLYTPDNLSDSDIDILFGVDSSPTNFKEVSKKLRGDLKNIMFFMGKNIIDIKLEAKTIFDFYISITTKNKNNSTLKFLYSDDIEQERFEKYIYKLTLVGVFDDWSVDFNAKYFEITPSLKTESDLTNHLIRYIQKYDYTFDLNDQHSENHRVLYDYFNNIEEPIILKLLYLLLKWTNDNVLYSRKRSMLLMKEFADNFKSSKELQEKVEQYFKRNDDVYFLEKIVGKREKLKEWFRIFFVSEAGKEDVVKSNQSVNELKITLNRFLESYDNDIALNMINGFLNLLTDDFDNRDGRQRLSKSLKEIHQMNSIVRNEIFNTILLSSPQMLNKEQLDLLSQLLIDCGFNSMDELKIINSHFDDIPSYTGILSFLNKSITEISNGGYPWEI